MSNTAGQLFALPHAVLFTVVAFIFDAPWGLFQFVVVWQLFALYLRRP